jgi:membrane-associated phospholipid phosphatase
MVLELIIRVIADIAVFPAVLIGAYALLFKIPKGQRFQMYSKVLLAGLTAYLLAKLVATVYQPSVQRPFELLGVEAGAAYLDNPGFPSDHALFVTAILAAVWFTTKNKLLSGILASLVIIVGVGRVLALVHTPWDVLAGVAIALIGALWYIQQPNEQSATVEKRGAHGKNNHRGRAA